MASNKSEMCYVFQPVILWSDRTGMSSQECCQLETLTFRQPRRDSSSESSENLCSVDVISLVRVN